MDIETKLFDLFILNKTLSKTIIDECTELPSYNTLCRNGYKIKKLIDKFERFNYQRNPTLCKMCKEEIEYDSRYNIFCSKTCSAKHNNSLRTKHKNCLQCGINFSGKKFCSLKCSHQWTRDQHINKWLIGEHPGYTGKTRQLCGWVRTYLYNTRGTKCSICSWDKVHPIDGLPLTEIDHIDGNAENNNPANLRILCPNCHAMTETYRARNKKSSRNRKL